MDNILLGNALEVLKTLPGDHFSAIITSPPFWGLRAYGTVPQIWGGDGECSHDWKSTQPRRKRSVGDIVDVDSMQMTSTASAFDAVGDATCIHCGAWRGELGSEPSPEMFISHLCDVFDQVKRVLRKDGVCWVNMGDSYANLGTGGYGMTGGRDKSTLASQMPPIGTAPTKRSLGGLKAKNLCLIPQRLAIELQRRGWYVRSMFQWTKQNPMPESCKDRPSNSHEWVIMLTCSPIYWYDIDAERVASKRNGDRQTFGGQKGRDYTPAATDPNFRGGHEQWGRDYTTGASRNLRTGDFMQMSLDAEIGHARNYLAYLHNIKRKGGIIHDDDGVPVGLFCNPKGIGLKHFATFPERFAEIFINLSVPSKCCAECGKGWKRVTERPTLKAGVDCNLVNRKEGVQGYAAATSSTSIMRVSGSKWSEWKGKNPDKLLGFTPDCSCDAPHTMEVLFKVNLTNKRKEKVGMTCRVCNANDFLASVEPCHKPGVVLDPFLGVATVGMVAERLGRRWIGIELSEEYVEMAKKRLEQESPLFAIPTVPEP